MPDTSLLFGPFLLGGCFNFMLYGICVLQTFLYFQTYSRDPRIIKLLVAYLFVMETINTGCTIGLLYEPLVLRYGDPESFQNRPLMLIADALLTVLISTPAQIFVAWRLRIVSQNSVIPIMIILLSLVSLGGGTRISVSVIQTPDFGHFSKFTPTVIVWLAASAAADLLITAGLIWSLMRRKFFGVQQTEDKVTRIIKLTIHTGFITMAFAIVDLVVFVARPNTTLNFIADFALSKLYTNSLLSTLNARSGWNHLGSTYGMNVLFDRSELSAMQKHQAGIESHGTAKRSSAFPAQAEPPIDNIELQASRPDRRDSFGTHLSDGSTAKTIGLAC